MGFPDSIHLGSVSIIGKAPDGSAVPLVVNQDGSPAPSTATVTPHTVAIGASASGTIPAGAKGFTFSLETGTGTLGGAAIATGVTVKEGGILASSLAYTTGSASTAFLYYAT